MCGRIYAECFVVSLPLKPDMSYWTFPWNRYNDFNGSPDTKECLAVTCNHLVQPLHFLYYYIPACCDWLVWINYNTRAVAKEPGSQWRAWLRPESGLPSRRCEQLHLRGGWAGLVAAASCRLGWQPRHSPGNISRVLQEQLIRQHLPAGTAPGHTHKSPSSVPQDNTGDTHIQLPGNELCRDRIITLCLHDQEL